MAEGPVLADLRRDALNVVWLTGTTYESALKRLLVDLSYEDVKRVALEAERLKFGSDTVTRDAAKRKATKEVRETGKPILETK